jgi:hypothetical protein
LLKGYYEDGLIHLGLSSHAHASKVAWRVIKDWLAAQIALIESEMATLDEVMLPYLIVGPDKQSLYSLMSEHQLMLPGPSA